MDVLPVPFRVLQICGMWYETDKPHWLIKYIWRPFSIVLMYSYTLALLGAFVIYRDNVTDFTECMFLSLTYLGLCLKLANFLARHDSMRDLLDEFRARTCRPRDERERTLIANYERMAVMTGNGLWGIALFSDVTFVMTPLLAMIAGETDVALPYKTYEVIDKTDPLQYWLSYAYQAMADTMGVFVNVSLDVIFAGLMLLTCAQMDVCCRRFAEGCDDERIRGTVKECVVHQMLIRRIVQKVEAFFMLTVVLQMFLSLVTLCTSVYNVSQMSISEAVPIFVYLGAMLYQLCCYCWFGNELKLKSTAIRDAIYNSDWTSLSPSNRRSLHIIMLSCHRDTTVSLHGLCALTIEIFVWVLKTAYSAYNLLKTVEN